MSAGRLSERLVIRTVTDATDAIGGKSETEATDATVWAEMIPVRADERLQAQAVGAQADYRFRTRCRADITAKLRARWTPRWPPGAATLHLEIHGVQPDTDPAFMVLTCGVFS